MSFDVDTSTDELAASLGVRYPSPARARHISRDHIATPLANRSPNIRQKQLNLDVTPRLLRGASPAKSMFFDPEEGADSPWRIKVTVQAEPRHSSPTAQRYSSPAKSPAPRTRVTRVPLKDADGDSRLTQPSRKKRKSDSGEAIKNRKGTPMRRRSGRQSVGGKTQDGQEHVTPPSRKLPATRKRGRPRRSEATQESEILDSILGADTDPADNLEGNGQQREDEEDRQHVDDLVDDGFGGEAEQHEHDQIRLQSQQEIREEEEEDDAGFVHINTFNDDVQSGNGLHEFDEAGLAAPLVGPPSQEPASRTAHAFDFTKLTPLHFRNSTQPEKQRTPPQRTTGLGYKAAEVYRDSLHKPFSHMFTPLPPRQPLIRSPSPIGRRQSSPATEDDADMWRGMVGRPQSRNVAKSSHPYDSASHEEEAPADSGSEEDAPHTVRTAANMRPLTSEMDDPDSADDEHKDDAGPDYDVDVLEPTARTIGEATMMQSEDFSIVSLSSLPSSKVNSSMLGQSQVDKSHLEHPRHHSRRSSGLAKTVTFSSPLAQSFHSDRGQSFHEDEKHGESDEEIVVKRASDLLPQNKSRHITSPNFQRTSHSTDDHSLIKPQHSRKHTPPPADNRRVSHKQDILRQSQTPDPNRLPTPSSGGESQISPPQLLSDDLPPSDISYPNVDDTSYPEVDNTPAGRSEAEMSTPPATPERDDVLHRHSKREASLMSSGGNSTRRSWADEPKSARMIALEKRWQQERENVARTIALAKGQTIVIVDDENDTNQQPYDDEDEVQAEPVEEMTEDIWQDISASFEDGDSHVSSKVRSTSTRPTMEQRPTKIARTEHRKDTNASLYVARTTPPKAFDAEKNMASVKRKGKVQADVSALFGRLGGKPSAMSVHVPKAPSPLRQTYDGTFDETDISALSDVRQIRNEMKAAKRPPFSHIPRATTTTIPTKLKSIDDTITTQGEEDMDDDMSDERHGVDQSVMSFTGHQPATRSLFGDASSRARQVEQPQAYAPKHFLASEVSYNAMAKASSTGPAQLGMFSSLWKTLTFSHAYVPPPRPSHPILNSIPFPLLPRIWPWSHTHWQTLDKLYQYYKRKPSRFSPSRTSHPDNRGLVTPSWSRYIDITFDHWGYRVRLESTHILLAILYTQLLILPSEREYEKVYSEPLEWGEQDRTEKVGERITEWDVLLHLFAVIGGEMLREDEREGRRVKREEVVFRYRLRGQREWREVVEGEEPRV